MVLENGWLMTPTLMIVSGPPGSGKTTLAHQIARAVGCPAICRDEIKEGMAHATPAFQDHVWRPRLTPLLGLAGVRVVHCVVGAEVAFERILRRGAGDGTRRAHDDPGRADRADHLRRHRAFNRVDLGVPWIEVDTTSGYRPGIAEIAAFAAQS
jgi:hypothetical protein